MEEAQKTQLRTIGMAAGIVAIILSSAMAAASGSILPIIVGIPAGLLLVVAAAATGNADILTRKVRSTVAGLGLGSLLVTHAVWLVNALPLGDSGTADAWPVISSAILIVTIAAVLGSDQS